MKKKIYYIETTLNGYIKTVRLKPSCFFVKSGKRC